MKSQEENSLTVAVVGLGGFLLLLTVLYFLQQGFDGSVISVGGAGDPAERRAEGASSRASGSSAADADGQGGTDAPKATEAKDSRNDKEKDKSKEKSKDKTVEKEKAKDKPEAVPPQPKVTPRAVGEPSRLGGVAVVVTSVRLDRPLFRSPESRKAAPTDAPELLVTLSIRNISDTRKYTYARWGESLLAPDCVLTDEHGTEYRTRRLDRYGGTYLNLPDTLRGEVRPGAAVEDTLHFARPGDTAARLRLVLKGSAVGQMGEAVFVFSRNNWAPAADWLPFWRGAR